MRVNVAEDNQSESQEQKEFALSKKQKTREKNEWECERNGKR